MAKDVIGEDAKQKAENLKPGQIMLLENVRFHREETDNNPEFAKQLASMAEIYVNDAFGAAHRAHASTAGVAEYLPAVSGFLIEKELKFLGKALNNPERPFVAILGGAKVSDKIGVIDSLLEKVDTLIIGYNLPVALLFFQAKMRKMEMENEVMQFQTIILMLMRIERVNVEMILEWLERYSNIFREPISRCVNNYESGPWEALEQMKDEINYKEFIRLIESMQAAVEKIPIVEAFDELDTEREYYQARRKESNDRLISKKGLIGKVIGFAPMVGLFVGYLIIPLVFIGLTSMTSSFNTMTAMKNQY